MTDQDIRFNAQREVFFTTIDDEIKERMQSFRGRNDPMMTSKYLTDVFNRYGLSSDDVADYIDTRESLQDPEISSYINSFENYDPQDMSKEQKFNYMLDKMDLETYNRTGDPNSKYTRTNYDEGAIDRIVEEAGLSPEELKEFQNYVNTVNKGDKWLADNRYDDINKALLKRVEGSINKEFERQAQLAEAERDKSVTDMEQVVSERDAANLKYLEDVEKFERDSVRDLDKAKKDTIERFDLAEDLAGESIQQAREYQSSPSLIEAELQSQLEDNLANNIRSRLAMRSRYGGGLSDPRSQQGADRVAMANLGAKAKLQEQILKRENLRQALNQGSARYESLGANRDVLGRANIGTKQSLMKNRGVASNKYYTDRQVGISDKITNRKQANEALGMDLQFADWKKRRELEPFRRGELMQAGRRGKLIGAGTTALGALKTGAGVVTGNPMLVTGGLGTMSHGVNAYQNASKNFENAYNYNTPGYLGTTDHKYGTVSRPEQLPLLDFNALLKDSGLYDSANPMSKNTLGGQYLGGISDRWNAGDSPWHRWRNRSNDKRQRNWQNSDGYKTTQGLMNPYG